jgi:hypothetical protein
MWSQLNGPNNNKRGEKSGIVQCKGEVIGKISPLDRR